MQAKCKLGSTAASK